MTDSIESKLLDSLGDVCVPFSSEEEMERGLDWLVYFFLESTKALLEKRGEKTSSGVLIQKLFDSLNSMDMFPALTTRVTETVTLIELYKTSSGNEKKKIAVVLKERGLL